MTAVPDAPTVLNTTAPSNFAYVDRMDLLETLPRVCTVPMVRHELDSGADSYPYLERALDRLGESIPVVAMSDRMCDVAAAYERRLDPGEAQALAVAAVYDGTVVTDDGPARSLGRDDDGPVTGSIGVLIRAVEDGRIDEDHADRVLKQSIDDTDYRAPSRDLSEYR